MRTISKLLPLKFRLISASWDNNGKIVAKSFNFGDKNDISLAVSWFQTMLMPSEKIPESFLAVSHTLAQKHNVINDLLFIVICHLGIIDLVFFFFRWIQFWYSHQVLLILILLKVFSRKINYYKRWLRSGKFINWVILIWLFWSLKLKLEYSLGIVSLQIRRYFYEPFKDCNYKTFQSDLSPRINCVCFGNFDVDSMQMFRSFSRITNGRWHKVLLSFKISHSH